MRFPIDVVLFDSELRVLRVAANVRPWRVVRHRGAKAVLELPANGAARKGLEPGVLVTLGEESR
jgi:uncharacterized membrane protein (UPF0127 family)